MKYSPTCQLSNPLLILCCIAWVILTGAGLLLLFEYQTRESVHGNPVGRWPTDMPKLPTNNRLLLVMTVHPRCPCTRSSLEALARIMAGRQASVVARVLVVKPRGVAAGWEQSDLWHSAAAIPGVEVVSDDAGAVSGRLGLKTSGHVLLFDRNEQRVFSGGITAGRGHNGDNLGLTQCRAFLTDQSTCSKDTPVFGCSLFATSN